MPPREPKHRVSVDALGNPARVNVIFTDRNGCQQYYAKWQRGDGRVASKSFAVSKLGAKVAYEAACRLAHEHQQEVLATLHAKTYHDNKDGTTRMNLRYKDTPVTYSVDTHDVPFLKTKTWVVTSEGYAVTTSPCMTYLHRFIKNAERVTMFIT